MSNSPNFAALKDLPALRDQPLKERESLFVKKLQLCQIIFAFDDPKVDLRGKDIKRQTLLELVDYVNTPAGQKIFTEGITKDLMACISANVCRALPPATDDFDPEEDEPVLEPAWPHLQVAYEFFLRFIVSSEVNAKVAKKHVDQKFCLQLVELFDSEDPRERDYLKTILHRIYGKFMPHRAFIRKAISNVFYRFIYDTERHNGVAELLEILGSIINGFALPLKDEHKQFLSRALIPLHKPSGSCIQQYHQQLSYCITQYLEKDPKLADIILRGLIKYWPHTNSSKEVMFLNELEELLELTQSPDFAKVAEPLFRLIARCINSPHFQVAERALFLWNNEYIVSLIAKSRDVILPVLYPALEANTTKHWNSTVHGLTFNVQKLFMDMDARLWEDCTQRHKLNMERQAAAQLSRKQKWEDLEKAVGA